MSLCGVHRGLIFGEESMLNRRVMINKRLMFDKRLKFNK